MNSNRLKGLMREHNETHESLGKALSISRSCMSNKINGKSEFTLGELNLIKRRYQLSIEQMYDIFFDD